jgi:hypothetical protein
MRCNRIQALGNCRTPKIAPRIKNRLLTSLSTQSYFSVDKLIRLLLLRNKTRYLSRFILIALVQTDMRKLLQTSLLRHRTWDYMVRSDSGSDSGSDLASLPGTPTRKDKNKDSSTLEKPNVLEWIQKASQFAISSTISQDKTAGEEHNAHQLLALLAQRLPTALASHSLNLQMCTAHCARLILDC